MIQKRVVGIVGTGNVGVAAAYSLFNQGLASEIILVDKDRRRAEGEAMDLMHGQALVGRVRVRAGGYEDLVNAQIVVITAGANQRPGESRLDLLNRNVAIFREIVGNLYEHAPNAILIVATNPVDIITYVIQELGRRPYTHVIGTGTMLDTIRFLALLGQHYCVNPSSIHADILGEHGDTEVPIWSNASVEGIPIFERTVLGRHWDRETLNGLFENVRRAAYEIIERKGYTNLAIGLVIARLVQIMLNDQKTVVPLSVRLRGEYGINNVCLSVPCVIGINGIEATVLPELHDEELKGICHSAQVLRDSLDGLDL